MIQTLKLLSGCSECQTGHWLSSSAIRSVFLPPRPVHILLQLGSLRGSSLVCLRHFRPALLGGSRSRLRLLPDGIILTEVCWRRWTTKQLTPFKRTCQLRGDESAARLGFLPEHLCLFPHHRSGRHGVLCYFQSKVTQSSNSASLELCLLGRRCRVSVVDFLFVDS